MPTHYANPPTTTPTPEQVAQLLAVAQAAHIAIRADGPAELMAIAIRELRGELAQLATLGVTFQLPEAWVLRMAERAGR